MVEELKITLESVKMDLQEALQEKERNRRREKERERQSWLECNRKNLCRSDEMTRHIDQNISDRISSPNDSSQKIEKLYQL